MATTKNITMKQFNGTDYDTLYPKTVYNQVSGVAPAGYGLGKEVTAYILDANTATEAGWYYWGKDTVNTPSNYGAMLVIPRFSNSTTQLAFLDTGGVTASQICVRKQMDGVWGEWEWVNPPMVVGTEYRTTERYQSKPVYVKLVNFGALPNSTSKSFAHEISDLKFVVDIYGSGVAGQDVKVSVDTTNITITSTSNLSSVTAYPVIKYTKTTD